MPTNPALREQRPDRADTIEKWSKTSERVYDLSGRGDAMTFYENITEMTKFIATTSKSAMVHIQTNDMGVTRLTIEIDPMP